MRTIKEVLKKYSLQELKSMNDDEFLEKLGHISTDGDDSEISDFIRKKFTKILKNKFY